jgi:hypothetical protein
MANHFWVGSLCAVSSSFPSNVIAVSDTLTILEDAGNHIPDRSWMLYLLELFEKNTQTPLELDLICQFNERNEFWAIFGGVNRYKFARVLPAVDHSYLREIIMEKEKKSIEYSLTDLDTKQKETFAFNVSLDSRFSYRGGNHFTGLEWWNKASGGNSPFPARYKVRVSNLGFSQSADAANRLPVYRPYNVLTQNSDASGIEYPVSFKDLAVKDGSIRYSVTPGTTARGMRFTAD